MPTMINNDKPDQRNRFKVYDYKNDEYFEPCDIYELIFEKRGRWHVTNCQGRGYEYSGEINSVTSHLLQYIHIKDKNGKHIYEFDKLKTPRGTEIIVSDITTIWKLIGKGGDVFKTFLENSTIIS